MTWFTLNSDEVGMNLRASLRNLLRQLPTAVAIDSARLSLDRHGLQMDLLDHDHDHEETVLQRRRRHDNRRHDDDDDDDDDYYYYYH